VHGEAVAAGDDRADLPSAGGHDLGDVGASHPPP
jgi:hypothetical protein